MRIYTPMTLCSNSTAKGKAGYNRKVKQAVVSLVFKTKHFLLLKRVSSYGINKATGYSHPEY